MTQMLGNDFGENMGNFNDLYPKQRTGEECKRTECERHKHYVAWQCGTSSLNFCVECKHAYVSQYKRKVPNQTAKRRSASA